MCPRGRAFTVGTCLSLKPTTFAREEYGRVVTTGSEEANGIGQITALLPPLAVVAVGCDGSNALCFILPLAFWQMNHY